MIGTVNYGQPQTTSQMLASAIAKFDSALAITAANGPSGYQTSMTNLASVGLGRALLDSGLYADAAAAVAAVPTDFEYDIEHSANSANQNNGIWEFSWNTGRWGVADVEGGNGLDFISANDPRVQVADNGPGFNGNDENFAPLKYPQRTSPAPVATGSEARLIEAEAALAGGGSATPILNTLRATAGLAALPAPGTPDAAVDQLFRERAFWLFLTSHCVGDLRRLIRQYHCGAETVFPTGTYFQNGGVAGTYGTDVNLHHPEAGSQQPQLPRLPRPQRLNIESQSAARDGRVLTRPPVVHSGRADGRAPHLF